MHRKKNSKILKMCLYILGLLIVGIIGFSISSIVNSSNKNKNKNKNIIVKKEDKKPKTDKGTYKSKNNETTEKKHVLKMEVI